MQIIRKVHGITLLELMVTVSIVAILASIVYPSYQRAVLKTNRSEAKTELMRTAEDLESCRGRFNAYNTTTCFVNANPAVAITPRTSQPSGRYIITSVAGTGLTADTYSLVATPQGGQANDTMCGNLTLDQNNVRGRSGTAAVTECW